MAQLESPSKRISGFRSTSEPRMETSSSDIDQQSACELLAISLGLSTVIDNILVSCAPFCRLRCVVLSDSRYAVNVCNGIWKVAAHHQSILDDIIKKLWTLKKKLSHPVAIAKIKAHSGIPGNETADKLAKICVQDHANSQPNFDSDFPVPFEVAKIEIKRKITEKWQRSWNTTGRRMFKFCDEVGDRPDDQMVMNREDFGMVVRFQTGHLGLNDYLYQRHLKYDDRCWECKLDVPETVEHFLMDCPGHTELRRNCFSIPGEHPGAPAQILPSKQILHRKAPHHMKELLLKYIHGTKRFLPQKDHPPPNQPPQPQNMND